jgi:hypothetical protein
MVDPARDCPACPSCKLAVGTPVSAECGVDRWDGPANATLFCPACGTGWVGGEEDVAQAWASWRAYEAEIAEAAKEG